MDLRLDYCTLSSKITLVSLVGEVDIYTYSQLRDFLLSLSRGTDTRMIIDLSKIHSIDSAGLGALVSIRKHMRAGNGRVCLVISDNQRLLMIFRISRFTMVFSIFSTVADAVSHMQAGTNEGEITPAYRTGDDEDGWHWFPARVYTSDEEAGETIDRLLPDLVKAFGMEVVYEFPIQHGSWFRQFILRVRDSRHSPHPKNN